MPDWKAIHCTQSTRHNDEIMLHCFVVCGEWFAFCVWQFLAEFLCFLSELHWSICHWFAIVIHSRMSKFCDKSHSCALFQISDKIQRILCLKRVLDALQRFYVRRWWLFPILVHCTFSIFEYRLLWVLFFCNGCYCSATINVVTGKPSDVWPIKKFITCYYVFISCRPLGRHIFLLI